MAMQFNERTWLAWLVKVRIIVITFLLGIGLVVIRLTRNDIDPRLFISVIVAWYAVAVFLVLMQALWDDTRLQSRVQILSDIAFCTATVYVSGGIDTTFNFLYPLVIIVAAILLPRWWAYLCAALSFIAFGAVLELGFFDVIRSYSVTHPDLKSLQAIIAINLFAYLTIAYLASNLAQKLRQVDVQLQDKSGALETLQTLQQNIIHSMRGGLITTDLEGRITLMNAQAQRLLETTPTDAFKMRVQEFFKDRLPTVGSGPVTGESRAAQSGGPETIFGITISALKMSADSTDGYVYTFDDVTDVKRLEREVRMRDRLAAVGRMAAGIAHEIRNPLASIAGSVQVLSDISELTEEQRTLVSIVTRESVRLNDIISDFLIYSREKTMKFLPLDIVALLDDTLTLLKNHPQQQTAPVAIIKDFKVSAATANVDGDRMKQVFWNLAENALRAMPQGGKLIVSLRGRGDDWVITFADSGTGIAANHLEKIFEPFQSSFGGGTGLGLAIVYQIVQAHDAKISVRSQEGKGAEFVLRLKRASIQAESKPSRRFVMGGARG